MPEEAAEKLITLINDWERDRKDEQGDTLAGRIANALYALKDQFDDGLLPVEKLVNKLKGSNLYNPSAQAVGRELTALGIKRKKSMGRMHILWDQARMEALWNRYGVSDEESP